MTVIPQQKRKLVVCRDLGPDAMSLLHERDDIEVILWPYTDRACDRQWLMDNIAGASGVIIMFTEKADREVLERAGPQLQVVSTYSVGYDHIDLKTLSKAGIRLGYTPDVLTDSVADLSVTLALMSSRNAIEAASVVQAGDWPNKPWAPFLFCGPQISAPHFAPTRTVGFLGFGRIARATLARLIPFGITHCIYTGRSTTSPPQIDDDPSLKPYLQSSNPLSSLKSITRVPLTTLASESDVLFLLAPGGPETYHIVNEAFLGRMKKTAVVVNTGRGTLIDSDALAKALREGWIWGAGLDVVEGEPVGDDHVLIKEPRCIVLPHIGSSTTETRKVMSAMVVKNALAALDGQQMPAELDLTGCP